MRRYAVIGGGIVGLATARALHRAQPEARITGLEKDTGPGRHQSGHDSGVFHSGF
ncbi:MAG: (S)-2-hydroxyglutarate dehydrogenase, partial [Pseudonocardiales bacterium]|nr:(S)-2-hydroxyglutarate dehydrogenase [Pseudonocardiales bacterium]